VITRTRLMVAATRTALAGIVAAGVLIFSMGVAVPSSGASSYSASESAFCKTLMGFATKEPVPSGTSLNSYKAWAQKIIPFYEQLASEAPTTGAKKTLTELVTILKDYGSASSLSKLATYEAANHANYLKGTKALSAAIVSCAKSL